MADVQVTSKQFSLNWQDGLKGLIVAVITTVLGIVENSLTAGAAIDWKNIGLTAITVAVAYLAKNFFTPATVQKPVTSAEVDDIKAKGVDTIDLVAKS